MGKLKQGEKGYTPAAATVQTYDPNQATARIRGSKLIDPGHNAQPDIHIGNPIRQIGGMIKKAMAYDPYKKKPKPS